MQNSIVMAATADKYYIKALDRYPFDLDESTENLNYALAADKFHCGANRLMGLLYLEHFKDFEKAEFYLRRALSGDPENADVCCSLAELFIRERAYSKADKLIGYTKQLKGVDLGKLYTLEALKFEYQKDYSKALEFLKKASDESYDYDTFENLKFVIRRVEEKAERNGIQIFR